MHDHGTTHQGSTVLKMFGLPIDITPLGHAPRISSGLQLETVDYRTGVLLVREGDIEMFKHIRRLLDPVWSSVYHPRDRLLGDLWDKRYTVSRGSDEGSEYRYEEYARGDIFKHRAVRGTAHEEVIWF